MENGQRDFVVSRQDLKLLDSLESIDLSTDSEKEYFIMPFLVSLKNITVMEICESVDNISTNDLCGMLVELYPDFKTQLSHFNLSILLICMKSLLKKWNGYSEHRDTDTIYKELGYLYKYLKYNLNYVRHVMDDMIIECQNQAIATALVQCPAKRLKTIFFNESNIGDSIINLKPLINRFFLQPSIGFGLKDVFNWPSIGIHLKLDNFEMYHRSAHESVFQLVKINECFKPLIKFKTNDLVYKTSNNQEVFMANFISEFLIQLKQTVQNSDKIPESKKEDIFIILDEFKSDIDFCTYSIGLGTEYYAPLSITPFVRLLGQPRSGQQDIPLIESKNQLKIDKDKKLNLRLQETLYPVIMFSIAKFEVQCELNSSGGIFFQLDNIDSLFEGENWLIYECLVCNTEYSGLNSIRTLGSHLIEMHGKEPDWFCTLCEEGFETKKLSMDRWSHKCKKENSKNITK